MVTAPNLAQTHSITYPTAEADIDFLVKIGILTEFDTDRRPKASIAPDVLDIAYSEMEEPGDQKIKRMITFA